MEGYIIGTELYYLVHRARKAGKALVGQSCYKVRVYIFYTAFPCNIICSVKILCIMMSAYTVKHHIVKSLGIYAYSRHSEGIDYPHLFFRYRIRSACLIGKFRKSCGINVRGHGR